MATNICRPMRTIWRLGDLPSVTLVDIAAIGWIRPGIRSDWWYVVPTKRSTWDTSSEKVLYPSLLERFPSCKPQLLITICGKFERKAAPSTNYDFIQVLWWNRSSYLLIHQFKYWTLWLLVSSIFFHHVHRPACYTGRQFCCLLVFLVRGEYNISLGFGFMALLVVWRHNPVPKVFSFTNRVIYLYVQW